MSIKNMNDGEIALIVKEYAREKAMYQGARRDMDNAANAIQRIIQGDQSILSNVRNGVYDDNLGAFVQGFALTYDKFIKAKDELDKLLETEW